jgi:hypothetical protein
MIRVVRGLKKVKPGRSSLAAATTARPAERATAATKSSVEGLIGALR